MPRTSRRQKVLNRLDEIIVTALKQHRLMHLLGATVPSSKDFIFHCLFLRKQLSNSRCIFRKCRCRRRQTKFHLCLDCDHDEALSNKEFKFHFRPFRDSFWQLVSLTQNHQVFKRRTSDPQGTSEPLGKKPHPPPHQLLVLLKCLSSEGNAASSVSMVNFFGIVHGLADDY